MVARIAWLRTQEAGSQWLEVREVVMAEAWPQQVNHRDWGLRRSVWAVEQYPEVALEMAQG